MIIIGLTGSIGMGKSTCAQIFARNGVPFHDSDVAAHDALSSNETCKTAIRSAFPYYEYAKIYGKKLKSGVRNIKRRELGALVFNNDDERQKLENIIHPFVWQSQNEFLKKHRALGAKITLLDIPLLFETGADTDVDITIVASAPPHIQRQRVLERPDMTPEKFKSILKHQIPDGEKRSRADYIINTGLGMAQTTREIKKILNDLRAR